MEQHTVLKFHKQHYFSSILIGFVIGISALVLVSAPLVWFYKNAGKNCWYVSSVKQKIVEGIWPILEW
jgi:hypothetical protein